VSNEVPVRDDDPVEDTLAGYAAAVSAKDVEAFLALYDEDATVFDMWGSWAYRGRSEWRPTVTDWFGSLGNDRVEVVFDEVQRAMGDGLATGHAFVTFKGLSADGRELRAMTNRLSWVLRRADDGNWKILHEHTSAPIDFETAKVILQR
jgi:uncharacterized protein (TIGR02246 family)